MSITLKNTLKLCIVGPNKLLKCSEIFLFPEIIDPSFLLLSGQSNTVFRGIAELILICYCRPYFFFFNFRCHIYLSQKTLIIPILHAFIRTKHEGHFQE